MLCPTHCGRLARAGRYPLADHLADHSAQQHPRHRHRLDPGAVPGNRRGSAADHHRGGRLLTFNPGSMFDRFTALPIQIYSYASRPQEAFIVLSSALIVVLLLILLVMNSVAIYIRNKYQRRW